MTFYLQTWEELFTGVMRTQVDGIGVTEMQFLGMFFLMMPTFFKDLNKSSFYGYGVVDYSCMFVFAL